MIGKRTTIDITDYYWNEDDIKKEIKSAEDYIGEATRFLNALVERKELLRRDRERTEANKQVEQLKKEKNAFRMQLLKDIQVPRRKTC